jgi:hypothetical protein
MEMGDTLTENQSDIEERESRWPSAEDRAFVEVHPLYGARVAERTDERLYRMITGFREAGDLLVEQGELEPYRRRNLLYPVIFTYRQSLELHLKYLLMAYGPLAGEAPDFPNHGLKRLWLKCKRVILFFEGDHEPAETFEAVEGRLAEFDAVDPGSDAFRFAHNTRGEPTILPCETVDLSNLRTVMASLHNVLECIDYQLRYGRDITPCGH